MKQVNSAHSKFESYLNQARWASVWHQLDEILKFNPRRVLEIDPGPGIFKSVAISLGVMVETLDIDPDLNSDYVSPADSVPFDDEEFDVVFAFRMLEHVSYAESLEIFSEMKRLAKKEVVISLPDADLTWPFTLYLPKRGLIKLLLRRPFQRETAHQFDGEHYWEISKLGYSFERVKIDLEALWGGAIHSSYRVHEMPYHKFLSSGNFILFGAQDVKNCNCCNCI